jgi:hypothetical protein
MRDFAEKQLQPLGHQVTIIDGDKPQPHHFAGLVEALKDADLLVLFSRRRFPPKDQMDAIRAHLAAGKPLLGIRTANHAFHPEAQRSRRFQSRAVARVHGRSPRRTEHRLRDQRPALHGQRRPQVLKTAAARWCEPANILGHQSLYKVLPLAADATPILIGTAKTDTSPPHARRLDAHLRPEQSPHLLHQPRRS